MAGFAGFAPAQQSRKLVSEEYGFEMTLPEGWQAFSGQAAKDQAKLFYPVAPWVEKRLDKVTFLFRKSERVGGVVYFAPYPHSVAARGGAASFWNKFVAHIRQLDQKYGPKELAHDQGYVNGVPFLRSVSPEPKLGMFVQKSYYRRWTGILSMELFCPLGQRESLAPELDQLTKSIVFGEPTTKSRHRGFPGS